MTEENQGHQQVGPEYVKDLVAPKLNTEIVDYSKFESLTEYLYQGLRPFCFMISRQIPKPFQKSTKKKTSIYSSRSGIKAYKTCIKLLKEFGSSLEIPPKTYQHKFLHAWYSESMILFVHPTVTNIPKELDTGEENYGAKCAIEAFKILGKELKSFLDGELYGKK